MVAPAPLLRETMDEARLARTDDAIVKFMPVPVAN